jgi:16S rRNA C967 or C1407 C5-methylase (RsmB/RsmF family)/NOL1/NOP2/fmu family ribosome biogenesis protein
MSSFGNRSPVIKIFDHATNRKNRYDFWLYADSVQFCRPDRPHQDKRMLPESFILQMKSLLGDSYPDFEAAMNAPAPISIRWAPGNASHVPGTIPVPWHPDAVYLPERPVFTLDPAFHAGAYYVQEASSMFLYEALRRSVDFDRRIRVLDLCAAPGGKSTLLVSMLRPDSLLVANEVIRSRVSVLRENLEKWGYPNVAVTSADPEVFADKLSGFFDVVVADAPCSGEGLFRRDPDAVQEWSPAHVDFCSARQRSILSSAVEALAPGGVLAFSTCTFNRKENEDNAAWLAETFGLEILHPVLPSEWGITDTEGGYRFFPHRVKGEGFFISLFRKPGEPEQANAASSSFISLKPLPKAMVPEAGSWLSDPSSFHLFQVPSGEILALPASLEPDYLIVDKALKNKWFGVNIGEFKGRDFIPSHALALSRIVSPALPAADLPKDQALLYLKRESFTLPEGIPMGWVLARYAGYNLGWMKVLPNRINNYLPAERRIRMDLDKGQRTT